MNILFLDSIEKETYGGMEEWIRLVANGLARTGHNITVVGRKNSEFLKRVGVGHENVKIKPISISGDFNPATIATLKNQLTAARADIVCVNFNKDVRLGGLAARWDGHCRVVWSVGLDITKDNLVHKLLTPKLVDGVIVPSESLKHQITSPGYIKPEIIEVIPIGIPERQFPQNAGEELRKKYNLLEDCLIAVTSGRFVEQKGHTHLIQAAGAVVQECPQYRFLLLGDGPLESSLKKQIEVANLGEHFIFAGMLDDLDLELAGADLMIHPSIEEPFGISVLEGLRAGLPVIASDVGGIPEVVGSTDTSILVESGDHEQLAAEMIKLAESSERRIELGRRARQRYTQQFSDELMCQRVEKYFETVLKAEQCHGKA